MFAIGVTITAALIFSLAPALYAARLNVAHALNRGRGGHAPSRRISAVLVVSEIALSVVLLVGAGLMIKTVVALHAVTPGFEATRLLTMQAQISPRGFPTADQRWQFYKAALERLSSLPGVESVSAVRPLPLESVSFTDRFMRAGSDAELIAAWHTTVPRYFGTMRIRLIEGRDFDEIDFEQRRSVVIVDERFAQQAWPGEHAVGQQLWRVVPKAIPMEVIGVVAHVHAETLRSEGHPQVYFRTIVRRSATSRSS